MAVKRAQFGELSNGTPIYEYHISNDNGVEAVVLNFGATIRNIFIPDKDGNRVIWGVRDSRYKDYYFTMRTHWENGNIKTRRVFKLFSREIK